MFCVEDMLAVMASVQLHRADPHASLELPTNEPELALFHLPMHTVAPIEAPGHSQLQVDSDSLRENELRGLSNPRRAIKTPVIQGQLGHLDNLGWRAKS